MNKLTTLTSGATFAQTQRFTLKLMEPKYKADFIRTLSPIPWLANQEISETVHERSWAELNKKDNITFSILDSATEAYIGYCQYKKIGTDRPDIGIELLPEYRGKGVGYEVCSVLIERFFAETDESALYYQVERQNTVSIALAEKLGAKRCGTEHIYDQLLSAIYSMTPEEKAGLKNAEVLLNSLEKFKDELTEEEYPTDILIYKIERKV